MSDDPSPAPPQLKDEDFEPVGRDRRFVVRLVLLMLLGLAAAAIVGWKLKGVAAGCGAGIVRPGTSVIPPESAH